MKFTKFIGILGLAFMIMQCSSSSVLTFKKEDGFNKNTKKVLTLSVYNMQEGKAAGKDDQALYAFGNLAASKMGDIYGSLIPGGELVDKAAEELKIKDKWEDALGELSKLFSNTSSGADAGAGSGNNIESTIVAMLPGTVDVLNTVAKKMGVDALALPVATAGMKVLEGGITVELGICLYDVRSGKVQYRASIRDVGITGLTYEGLKNDKDKLKKAIIGAVTDAGNKLMGLVETKVAELSK